MFLMVALKAEVYTCGSSWVSTLFLFKAKMTKLRYPVANTSLANDQFLNQLTSCLKQINMVVDEFHSFFHIY